MLLRSGDDEPGPDATAGEFASAWEDGDDEALRGLVVDAASLDAVDPVAIAADLGATEHGRDGGSGRRGQRARASPR